MVVSGGGGGGLGAGLSGAGSATVTTALFCASAVAGVYLSHHHHHHEVVVQDDDEVDEPSTRSRAANGDAGRILSPGRVTVAYASTTGTCRRMARELRDRLVSALETEGLAYDVRLRSVHEFDWWDEFLNNESDGGGDGDGSRLPPPVLILLLPTWTGGTLPPPVGENRASVAPAFPDLLASLDEIATDWRVPRRALASSRLVVSVLGVGSSEYDPATFCKPARTAHRTLVRRLGVARLLTRDVLSDVGRRNWNLTTIDESVAGDAPDAVFRDWTAMVARAVTETAARSGDATSTTKKKKPKKKNKSPSTSNGGKRGNPQADSASSDDDYPSSEEENDEDDDDEPDVVDVEDMGSEIQKSSKKVNPNAPLPEMVTKKQAAALKKEGYKLIGTHSAVKLCRWTKHQLRGRGGCYKHTFYGITSYRCMESTPSLACANKCVFCWRHHKNPVGTSWKWKTDDPYVIVADSVAAHVRMIRETKGIPGVLPSRWNEALTVKHCALSLVGEPIMYPRINEFVGELHRRRISTFLVTNGQHPEAIAALRPVTQLYVSVDAPTPESLEAVDRPLFADAWSRLRRSLRCLRDKGQRTVARLTVVKGWNSDEIGGYAELIALGRCSLIEVKGVTFCGKSDASNLNMTNTPWHHEVLELTLKLKDELARLTALGGDDAPPVYGLACEHKHSCSVLLAREDLFLAREEEEVRDVDGAVVGTRPRWRTWIDYDRFHDLAEKHSTDPTFSFGVEDFSAPTPDWALAGAAEEGFDPTDTRHFRKQKLYSAFDADGVPTRDARGADLPDEERARLRALMEERRRELEAGDDGVLVVDKGGKGGEKEVRDVRLMFRGMVEDKRKR